MQYQLNTRGSCAILLSAMAESLRSAILRVENHDGSGAAAFMISSRVLITACHAARLGTLFYDFLGHPVRASLVGRIEADDLAVYKTDEDMPFLPLVDGADSVDVGTYGFPAIEGVEGLWAVGKIRGETTIDGRPRLQIQSQEITCGFSGAPLHAGAGAVGLIVSVIGEHDTIEGRLGDVAFGIPAGIIAEHCQRLGLAIVIVTVAATISRYRAGAITELAASRARCFARWRAVGVEDGLARLFSNDPTLGIFPDINDVIAHGGLRFVVGEFGAGKSLGLERVLQRIALQTIDCGDDWHIVYRDARSRLADQTFDPAVLVPQHGRLALFVDNAEALGMIRLQRLVDEMRALHFLAPKACIIVTSRPTGVFVGADDVITMPTLATDDVRSLVLRIAPFANVDALIDEQGELLGRPLFAILAAQHPQISRGPRLSPGDLLAFLAERVFTRLDIGAGETGPLLRRLAVMQTDAGGDLVPIVDVAMTMERQGLIDSGYLTYDPARRLVGFTLPILSQWFAAQALEAGDVCIADFTDNELRLESWRDVFMLRITTSSDDAIDTLFAQLVKVSAGFAVSLAQRDVPNWFAQRDHPRPSARRYAARLRTAMAALLDALGPLAAASPFADTDGLYDVGARIEENGQLYTAWRCDRATETFELDRSHSMLSPTPGFTKSTYHRFVDVRPAWNWLAAASDVGAFLLRVFQWQEYASARSAIDGRQLTFEGTLHEHELAWQAALSMLDHGSLHPDPIPLLDITESGALRYDVTGISGAQYLGMGPLRSLISRLQSISAERINPPWPMPETRGGHWVWSGYSEAALLRRVKVVHQGALELYANMVLKYFGLYAKRMPLFAAMPFDLRITVTSLGDEDEYSPPIGEWTIVPFVAGPNIVTVRRGLETSLDAGRQAFEAAARLRPEFRSYAAYPHVDGVLDVFGTLPITEIAYSWLRSDIESLFGK